MWILTSEKENEAVVTVRPSNLIWNSGSMTVLGVELV
jgi:hypothetical protein